ncbi:MAG TPA: glycosyltransferase family 4 protein [Syntrophorhabdaceae bacterium]|nr:glycosyltransferase family 4 protein [Syntrophorhabdaceae bacterium]
MSRSQPAEPKLLFLRYGSFSGINRYLVEGFREKGFRVIDCDVSDAINPKRTLTGMLLMPLAMTIFGKRWADAINYLPFVFRLLSGHCQKTIEREDPDVIFQTQTLFAGAVNPTRKPYFIYTDHTHLLTEKAARNDLGESASLASSKWIDLEKACYHRATTIFTMSNYIKNSLISDYEMEESRIETVYPGINVPVAKEQRMSPQGKKVLFVGIDFKRKGGPVLLEAFSKVKNIIPDAKLTIVGCHIENSDPNIIVKGKLSLELTAQEFRTADIFVMPSLREPFGIVFLEAMANGLPCVGTRIESIPEIIDDGETGYLIEPNNAGELAEKIIDLLGNPAKRKRMGENGFEKARKFSWTRSVEQMVDCIRKDGEDL